MWSLKCWFHFAVSPSGGVTDQLLSGVGFNTTDSCKCGVKPPTPDALKPEAIVGGDVAEVTLMTFWWCGFGDDDFYDIANDDDRFNFHDSHLLLTILMMMIMLKTPGWWVALDCCTQPWISRKPCNCHYHYHDYYQDYSSLSSLSSLSLQFYHNWHNLWKSHQVTDGSNQFGCGGTLVADNWVEILKVARNSKQS